jgi:hypothetical protein
MALFFGFFLKRKRNDYEINDKREMVYFQEKNPQMTSAIKITF